MSLNHKIDFALIFRVRNANPNGDPLNGNRPRTDYAGLGEVTDVCLKRKIRDRLVERWSALEEGKRTGQAVFVQSDDRKVDGHASLRERADALLSSDLSSADLVKKACDTWIDVRSFGQLFAFKGKSKGKGAKGGGDDAGVSIGIRGPVTIHSGFSIEPISITSTQITKSVSGEGDGSKRGSDTMGMKHRVDLGVYVTYGSINPQLAERTGFSAADAETLKATLPRLFENDASAARPEGSMEVLNALWWSHPSASGSYGSAKVHRSLKVNADGTFEVTRLEGLEPQIISGF